jgi:hypothetical protein
MTLLSKALASPQARVAGLANVAPRLVDSNGR